MHLSEHCSASQQVALAPETGKKLRADVKKKLNEFYAYIAPQLKKLKSMGEEDFQEFVTNAAKTYSKAKKLSTADSAYIVSEAKKSWKHIKKQSAYAPARLPPTISLIHRFFLCLTIHKNKKL